MRKPTADLRRSLQQQRVQQLREDELRSAIELLSDPDTRLQRLVGEALIRTGVAATPLVAGSLAAADPPARRAAAFVLGELLQRAPDHAAAHALRSALSDDDAKVRKNAAVALGKLADTQAAADLVRQLQVEPMHYVRPSIILALGTIGGAAAHTALADFTPRTEEDARALQLALERSGDRSLSAIDTSVPIDVTLDLLCRFGAESFLSRELSDAGARYQRRGPGFVRVAWRGSLADLFRYRCYDTVAFPVLEIPEDPLDRPIEVADAFVDAPGISLVPGLTERGTTQELRYRVTFELPPGTGFRRRDWIAQFKTRLEQRAHGFVNSPGRYSWEFLLRYAYNTWYFGIRPTAYADPRFAYRVADVPAALNPSVAAAMARRIPCAEYDIVVDPFCGSGTLLVERARYAPYSLLVGVDRDRDALASARQNIEAAGIARVKLLEGDAYQLQRVLARNAIEHVDAIITNPPYGVRVSSPDELKRLYPAMMKQAASLFGADGHLVMLAKDGNTARAAAQRHGFRADQEFRVDTGGIRVWLFVFRPGS